jgi:hypothetical protein
MQAAITANPETLASCSYIPGRHDFNPKPCYVSAGPINKRAKLPAELKALQAALKVDFKTILSTNPKTEKSAVQTYILHLAPADTSGVNICPGAGNCRKICLHFAGNPVYMTAKQAARIRRTLAYSANPQCFMLVLICAILDKINKHASEPLAFRLNGTSDVAWENVDFTITPEFATFCRIKFGAILPIGKRNIFEVFNFMRDNTGENVTFYDYTKIRRNWAECKRLGYHLTFSFDGWNNATNLKLASDAMANNVNLAAAFSIKKGQPLAFDDNSADKMKRWLGAVPLITDGDLTDYRPADPNGGVIVGLRFKLPHGIAYSAVEREAFCIA